MTSSWLDVLAAEYRDPYPTYAALRASSPVHWDEERKAWGLLRYCDVAAALRDGRFSASRVAPRSRADGAVALFDRYRNDMMLYSDPPKHSRLRGLVSKAFAPAMVQGLRARVQEITETLIDGMTDRRDIDVVGDFAQALPLTVISELLGVDREDRALFAGWTDAFLRAISAGANHDLVGRGADGVISLERYLTATVSQRKARPGKDIVSALVAARDAHDRLSEQEMVATLMLLLFAGHETVTGLLTNGLIALAEHPAQLAWLRANPQETGRAVEELLRFDSPVQMTARLLTEDVTIDGHRLAKGHFVRLVLGAANRDPARFPAPDVLDLRRDTSGHLGFGSGNHFCLGSGLARLEAEVGLRTLLSRVVGLRVTTREAVWSPGSTFRFVKALPASFERVEPRAARPA